MNLPPLPSTRFGQNVYITGGDPVRHPLYTEADMREYGTLCRKQALEQAAKKVDHIMFFNGKTFGEKIMELLK